MQKRDVIIRFSPIVFIVIMFCLGSLTIYLWIISDKFFWRLYLILQMFGWSIMGIVVKILYVASHKDQLTNLWNNRYLYLKLKDEINKMKHNKSSALTIAILDIDGFKDVNDKYGHLEGDKILVDLGKVLKENVRKTDSVIRWAGDEFVIILSDTDKVVAIEIMERVKHEVDQYNFKYRITVSCGIACIKNYTEISNLMEMADHALYKAKKTKNTIVSYEI